MRVRRYVEGVDATAASYDSAHVSAGCGALVDMVVQPSPGTKEFCALAARERKVGHAVLPAQMLGKGVVPMLVGPTSGTQPCIIV